MELLVLMPLSSHVNLILTHLEQNRFEREGTNVRHPSPSPARRYAAQMKKKIRPFPLIDWSRYFGPAAFADSRFSFFFLQIAVFRQMSSSFAFLFFLFFFSSTSLFAAVALSCSSTSLFFSSHNKLEKSKFPLDCQKRIEPGQNTDAAAFVNGAGRGGGGEKRNLNEEAKEEEEE